MLFYTQRFGKLNPANNITAVSTVDVGVHVNKTEAEKYFLFAKGPIYETGLYLVGYYILKDI